VLDAAAITIAALDVPRGPQAPVIIRAGSLALKTIASFYGVPLDANPEPNAPISIYREEFDLLLDRLADEGLPVTDDREAAWRAFAGWRVNYDQALLALCSLCSAPATPWSSDRAYRYQRPTFLHQHWTVDPLDNPRSW